jgi:hypothetical protein
MTYSIPRCSDSEILYPYSSYSVSLVFINCDHFDVILNPHTLHLFIFWFCMHLFAVLIIIRVCALCPTLCYCALRGLLPLSWTIIICQFCIVCESSKRDCAFTHLVSHAYRQISLVRLNDSYFRTIG